MTDIHGNEQLLVRTKWFLRAKISVCIFVVVILVPWYKSVKSNIMDECEGTAGIPSNDTEGARKKKC